jgi:NAD+ diphosphatase
MIFLFPAHLLLIDFSGKIISRKVNNLMSHESIYKRYTPAVSPTGSENAPALWFAFSSTRLLVDRSGATAMVPFTTALEELGVTPVRSQYIGEFEGRPCYSAELPVETAPPRDMSFHDLRSLYGFIDEDVYVLAGRALQIVTWDQTHQFCGKCGHTTEDLLGERAKKCPACGFISFPRLSPATITAVLKDDRILLAHYASFRGNMHTIIAGFVEPGETLEECVQREVFEEVGVRVRNIRYFASQPWPFPNSLMIGFLADYESGEIVPDGKEISRAAWYSADNLPDLPPKMAIAHDIIDWFVQTKSRR